LVERSIEPRLEEGVIVTRTVLICSLLAGGLITPSGQVAGPQAKEAHSYPMSVLRPVSFNYLIYSDKLVWPEEPLRCRRDLYVLMDENAFSEDNLKELFGVLSDAFPDPSRLRVMVHTSLEQVRPLGPIGVSEQRDPPNAYKHHLAGYSRIDGNEYFRYIAHPPEGKWTTVVIKGVDPSGEKD
jgi:hypothetical protein